MPRRTRLLMTAAPAVLGAAALLAPPARARAPVADPDRVLGVVWCDEAGVFQGAAREIPLLPPLAENGVRAMVAMPGIDPAGPVDLVARADGAARLALRARPAEVGALVAQLQASGWVGDAQRLRKAGSTHEESIQIDAAGALVYERRLAGSGGGPIPPADALVGGLRARGGCGAYVDTRGVGLLGGGDFDAAIAWFAKDLRSAELRLRRAQPIQPPPIIPPVVVESPGAPMAVLTLGAAPGELFDAIGRLPLPPKARDAVIEARRKLGDDALPGAGAIIRIGQGPLGGMEMIGAIPTGPDGKRGSGWRSRRLLRAAVRGLSDELIDQGAAAPTRIDRSTWRVTMAQRKEAVTLRVADGLLLFSTSVDSMLGVDGAGGAPWLGAEGQAWAAAHHVALLGEIPGALLGRADGAPVMLRVGMQAEADHAVLRIESSVPFDQLMQGLPSRAAGALQGPLNLGQPML